MKWSSLLAFTAITALVGGLCLAVVLLPSCRPGATGSGIFPAPDADASASNVEQRERDAGLLRGAWNDRKLATEELVAGRISLAKAVARFRAVDDGLPDRLRSRGDIFPEGRSPEERYWRYVIRVTLSQLIDDPRRDQVAKRLEGELQDFLRSRLGPEADDGGARLAARLRKRPPPVPVPALPLLFGQAPARGPSAEAHTQTPVTGHVEW